LQLEDARQAIDSYKQALAIHRELGDRRGEGTYLLGLGNAYGRLGDSRRAIDYYEQALGIHREIGDVLTAAMCSANLGWALAQIGHVNEAVDLLQQAVRDFQQAGHPQQAQPALRILAELQSEEPSGPTNSPNTAEILSQFAPVIEDTVAAARGIHTAKAALDQAFPMLTQKGWQLTEPIHRIWAGERDAGKLTAGLNESESIIIHEILRQL
jgi:tetratricopeptide (TPR) repeat protein